jgi:hypothetical protein
VEGGAGNLGPGKPPHGRHQRSPSVIEKGKLNRRVTTKKETFTNPAGLVKVTCGSFESISGDSIS